MSTSEGERRWDGGETKYERQDGGGLDMCRGKMMYIGRWILKMELPGKTKLGRSKRRVVDAMKKDMAIVEVTDEDAQYRSE